LRTGSLERQRHRAHDEKPHRRREEIPVFDKAVSNSTIQKASREKDAKAFAQRFQNNTEAMLRQFQKQQEGGRTLPVVLQGARNIERSLQIETQHYE
jgi:hypothetical protein